nr:DUF2291 domain-containing protein [uncultured Clostridium sp.]
MKKRILSLVMITVLSSALMTGCVKIVKIGEEGKITGKTEFNAGDSVSEMWESAVADIEGKAIDLPEFLKEANGDVDSLADKYGKYSMGTTGTVSYAVKGSGVIEEVNQEKKAGYMTVKLDNYDGKEIIKLQIGTVYKGSSTRDSLDIINFGDFTNQEEWAAISQQLHSMIDKNVIQPADPASLKGKNVAFVGTFTADDDAELLITPVSLTVK